MEVKNGNVQVIIDTNIPKLDANVTKVYKKRKIIYRTIKRIFDIFCGLIGAICLIPMTILIWFIRKINKDENGPVFYKQLRLGKNGRYFKIYKYRTMVVGADEILIKYLEENEDAKKEYDTYKKLKNDPRITKLGNFLRKTSLDEFPQFINVLKGDMSIIGPRPYLSGEVKDMNGHYEDIIQVKPGITGMWQVSGRSNKTYEERVKLESTYAKECSLWLDIKIFFKTIIIVLRKEGAK